MYCNSTLNKVFLPYLLLLPMTLFFSTFVVRNQSQRLLSVSKTVSANHVGRLRALVPRIIEELHCKGPANTQVQRLLDIVDTRGWNEAVRIFNGIRAAVIAYATGDSMSKEEAATLSINIMSDGIPRVLLGEYRDSLRQKDKVMIQEILTILDLRLLTPDYKNPNQETITGVNPSNLSIEEISQLVRDAKATAEEAETVTSHPTVPGGDTAKQPSTPQKGDFSDDGSNSLFGRR